VLSAYLATLDIDFNVSSFIELGAGTGLPSLVVAKLGAHRTIISDKLEKINFSERLISSSAILNNIRNIEIVGLIFFHLLLSTSFLVTFSSYQLTGEMSALSIQNLITY